jgi:hypothetical protein
MTATGEPDAVEALERAFSILTGRPDGNDLGAVVQSGRDGRFYFLNDNCWWRYVDFQCTFHATFGWRPFTDIPKRLVEFNTWDLGFRYQATEELIHRFREAGYPCVPPVGFLPQNAFPLDETVIDIENFFQNFRLTAPEWSAQSTDPYADTYHLFDKEGRHDVNCDYPLMNVITATDWLLWERDTARAAGYCRQIEDFLAILYGRMRGGLLLVGPQGSQIEWGHRGLRYPSSTHVYLLKVLRNLREVYLMLCDASAADKCAIRAEELENRMAALKHERGWWLSSLAEDGTTRLGTGELTGESGYFEVWPNVNSVILGIATPREAEAIVGRLTSIPALVENHLTLSNYPARPVEELDDDHDGFPPPGTHLNGGWHWMHGGSALGSLARVCHPDTIKHLQWLLDDHARHLSADYYNDWGRDKESQWKHLGAHGPTYSVTCAGAFGMLFRAILGVSADARGLIFSPTLPPGVDSITLPLNYAGRSLSVTVSGKGSRISAAKLDGRPCPQHDGSTLRIDHSNIPDGVRLEIRMEG